LVKIRLKRMGSKGRPFYRIVVANSTSPRDGRHIDQLGYYDPMTDPATIKIDADKTLLWLQRGAQPSEGAVNILRKEGILDRHAAGKKGAAAGSATE
jgi:small subunit ribosomal protein S16